MGRRIARMLAVVVVLLASRCAPARPSMWVAAMAAGDRAVNAGRWVEAAGHYARAGERTRRDRDRHYAIFLSAWAIARSGDARSAIARYDSVASASPPFEHGARAQFDAAALRLRSGDETERQRGMVSLEEVIGRDPRSGPARSAVTLALRELDLRDPSLASGLTWLDALAQREVVRRSPLVATAQVLRARRLEMLGREAEAESAWESALAAAPYPQNRHWDDGHFRLAQLRRRRGNPRGAVATLDRMLEVREPSYSSGSYEAPRFDDGAMLRGQILRDDLGALGEAVAAFRYVAGMPTSRLRDDALEAEARLHERLADGRACAVWGELLHARPRGRRADTARSALAVCGRGGRRP